MGPRRQPTKTTEFPILEANGLYASQIKGDGNCLFNALSDQIYGHQNEHRALRDATINYMRAHSEFYRQYMIVNPVRRNPKRKTTAALVVPFESAFHTPEDLQRQFELHVEKMGQPGEWADHMEVSAFASALKVHVRLWQSDFQHIISPRASYASDSTPPTDARPILNIAYHTWEHYSSVRNIAGPHTGPPQVSVDIQPSTLQSRKRPSEERDDDDLEYRATKRRSPLPLFDSDSTPECSESSSDESNPAQGSQDAASESDLPEPLPKLKLILKLRPTPPV